MARFQINAVTVSGLFNKSPPDTVVLSVNQLVKIKKPMKKSIFLYDNIKDPSVII